MYNVADISQKRYKDEPSGKPLGDLSVKLLHQKSKMKMWRRWMAHLLELLLEGRIRRKVPNAAKSLTIINMQAYGRLYRRGELRTPAEFLQLCQRLHGKLYLLVSFSYAYECVYVHVCI